jgi:hypothetical protein
LITFPDVPTANLALQLNVAQLSDAVGVAVCYPSGSTVKSIYRGFAGQEKKSPIPSLTGATTIPAASSFTNAAVQNGTSYYFDASRSLLYVTVKSRQAREDYGAFCPSNGCDFVWINMNIPAGATARDCTADAYSGANTLQDTTSAWYNLKLTPM